LGFVGTLIFPSMGSSGQQVQKHAAFAPARQKLLDFRPRSPLPTVEEPCPLGLPYGFFTCWPLLELEIKTVSFREEPCPISLHRDFLSLLVVN
jgi:hypothetical protein